MTLLQSAPRAPGAQAYPLIVTIDLIDGSGLMIPGYVPGADLVVEGRLQFVANGNNEYSPALGDWEVELQPNADIEPADTLYRITEQRGRSTAAIHYVTIPGTGGPFTVFDVLAVLPGSLPSHIAATTDVHGIPDTALLVDAAALASAVEAEETRATAVEDSLTATIDAEETRATAAEATISASVAAEVTARAAAVSAEQAARIADVNAEESRASLAEAALTASISAETTRATAAEAAVAASVAAETAARTNDVNAEETRALAAEAALAADVDGLGTDLGQLDTAIGDEEARALAAEAALSAAAAAHAGDTTGVHGIADTAALVVTSDPRLSDTRTPTDNSVTQAKVQAGSLGIDRLAVDPRARATHSGTQLADTISDLTTAVRANRLDQMAPPAAPVDLNGQRITNGAMPVADTDLIPKAYADGLRAGLLLKADPVRVMVDANVNINSPGAVHDGIALVAGVDSLLLTGQTSANDNGIYLYNGPAVPLTRRSDANTSAEMRAGTAVWVTDGAYQDQRWVLVTSDPITLGVTALAWAFDGGLAHIVAGDGLTSTANRIDVVAGAGLVAAGDSIGIAAGGVGTTELATGAVTDAKVAAGIDQSKVAGLVAALTALAPIASPTFTGVPATPALAVSGLTGSTAASRYVGGTVAGAPTTGAHLVGDYVIDQTGKIWVCTVAGTPGTWVRTGGAMPLQGTQTSTTRQNIFELQPASAGVGHFSAGAVGTVFAGTTDHVFDVGYNARKGVLNEPSWTQTVEHDFNEGGFHWLEAYNEFFGMKNPTGTITNKARTSSVATITTSAAHGLAVGDGVKVSTGDTSFDGNWTVASTPSATTFTYSQTGYGVADVASTASGGSIAHVSYRPIFFGIGRANGELIRSQYLAGSAGFQIFDWAIWPAGELANISKTGAQFNTGELTLRAASSPRLSFEVGPSEWFSVLSAAPYLTQFIVGGSVVALMEYGPTQGACFSVGTDGFGAGAAVFKLTGSSLSAFELRTVWLQKAADQIGPLLEWTDTDDVTIWGRISKNGYYETRRNAAPANDDLAAGALMLWVDTNPASPGPQYKMKDSDGTVRSFDFSRQPGIPDTSGATLGDLESEVNAVKEVLRAMGVLAPSAVLGLTIPLGGGTYASAPDSAALSVVNADMDVQVQLSLDDWTPAADRVIASKHGGSGGYIMKIGATGVIYFDVKGPALADRTFLSTAAAGFADGSVGWVRALFVYAAGSGNSSVTFYTSPPGDSPTWTQLGTVVTNPQGGPGDGTEPLTIGAYSDLATQPLGGTIYRLKILTGATVLFDATFMDSSPGSFTEDSPNAATVTVTA